jgi:predicted N-acetyltransferase YhbS
MTEIIYKVEKNLDPSDFIDILNRSTLGERRPVDDTVRMKKMCENANLVITAGLNGKLIGVALSISDFVYCTYLSDLAVDVKFQKKGIGKKLIEETKKQAPHAKLILLSAPAAVDYYPKIGMKKHNHCFIPNEIEELG